MTLAVIACINLLAALGALAYAFRLQKQLGKEQEKVMQLHADLDSYRETANVIAEVRARPVSIDASDIDRL